MQGQRVGVTTENLAKHRKQFKHSYDNSELAKNGESIIRRWQTHDNGVHKAANMFIEKTEWMGNPDDAGTSVLDDKVREEVAGDVNDQLISAPVAPTDE